MVNNERVYARNVVVYVHEIPVLWLPYFVHTINNPFPWQFEVGQNGSLGNYLRVIYTYYQTSYRPSDDDPNTMERSGFLKARVINDYFTQRGWGKGLDAYYAFDGGRSYGIAHLYQLDDSERGRDVTNESDPSNRYYANLFHRTKLSDELQLLVDVDYPRRSGPVLRRA